MRTRYFGAFATIAILCGLAVGAAAEISSRADDLARIHSAELVFKDFASGAGKQVAQNVLVGGSCVAIIPGNKSFAFGVGGIYGKGIATCRDNNGRWGAPVFITIGGASFGLQFGGESADLILVFRDMAGLEAMLNNKLRLGVQASAAAGPIGRQAEASTDASLHAQVLAYGKSRGLYAGINLNGAIVQTDESGNRAMYGQAWWEDVLEGKVAPPPQAQVLLSSLDNSPWTNPTVYAAQNRAAGAAAQPAGQAGQQVKQAFGAPTLPLQHFSIGFGYMHQRTTIGLDGVDLNLGLRPALGMLPGLKLVADVSHVGGSTSLLGASAHNSEWLYLVGPEFDVPRRLFSPYGHVLFGEGHLNTSLTTSTTTTQGGHSFAWEAGAGLRLTPAKHFNVTILELDLLHTSFSNQSANNIRLGFGVGYTF